MFFSTRQPSEVFTRISQWLQGMLYLDRRHGVRVAKCGHEPVVASLPSSPTLLPGGEGSVVLPA
jgi:hypothetical protein